jgi:hypothetical protein
MKPHFLFRLNKKEKILLIGRESGGKVYGESP